jgi:hypothetical protein
MSSRRTACVVPAAAAVEVPVTFDADLAATAGATAFEQELRAMVGDARARVVAAPGMEPGAGIAVRVHSRAGMGVL